MRAALGALLLFFASLAYCEDVTAGVPIHWGNYPSAASATLDTAFSCQWFNSQARLQNMSLVLASRSMTPAGTRWFISAFGSETFLGTPVGGYSYVGYPAPSTAGPWDPLAAPGSSVRYENTDQLVLVSVAVAAEGGAVIEWPMPMVRAMEYGADVPILSSAPQSGWDLFAFALDSVSIACKQYTVL